MGGLWDLGCVSGGRCHKTTARAARLERSGVVTRIGLSVSGPQGARGFQLDAAEDVATLPRVKGWTGFVRGSA